MMSENKNKLPLEPPNSNQLAKIRKELNEDDEKLSYYMQLFKKWIECESYLPNNVDDALLENFIRLSKYNLERAKNKFEMYIIVRNNLLQSVNVELTDYDFDETDLTRLCIIFPTLSTDGYRILYGRAYDKVETFDINAALKYLLDVCDILLHSDVNAGFVLIFDFKSFTMNFLSKIDMSIMKSLLDIIFNIQPARVQRLHILNLSPIAKTFVVFMKSLMSEKMKNRIIVHMEEKELLGYIEKDLLPPELGGCNVSLAEIVIKWKKYMVGNEELKKRVQSMALRHPIPKSKAHLDPSSGFGATGTFRQLNLD